MLQSSASTPIHLSLASFVQRVVRTALETLYIVVQCCAPQCCMLQTGTRGMCTGRPPTAAQGLEETGILSERDCENCTWQAGPGRCRRCKPWTEVQCYGAAGLLPGSGCARAAKAQRPKECAGLVYRGGWHLGEDCSSIPKARCSIHMLQWGAAYSSSPALILAV